MDLGGPQLVEPLQRQSQVEPGDGGVRGLAYRVGGDDSGFGGDPPVGVVPVGAAGAAQCVGQVDGERGQPGGGGVHRDRNEVAALPLQPDPGRPVAAEGRAPSACSAAGYG
ncbi:hypothetical protein [Micromonospora matsumotoense]|uniref:hypothetical protein n=1 Tax=Micromonospora matsumotoense TaxID=121616 RepID=UPI0033FECB9A